MTAPNHPRDYTTSRRWSISARSSRILPSVRQRHWTLRRSRARDSLSGGWPKSSRAPGVVGRAGATAGANEARKTPAT